MPKEFKLIVAGGRDFNDRDLLEAEILSLVNKELKDRAVSIVSGMARGADRLAYEFAKRQNIKLYEFPADWNRYKRAAGYRRNIEMAKFADGLLAFLHINPSKGTSHMIKTMQELGKPYRVVRYGQENQNAHI